MTNEKTQNLMEKIALLLQESEKGEDDSTFLRQSLERINSRLDKIESQLAHSSSRPEISSLKSIHPSQEKLTLIESLVDEIIINQKIEKACIFETKKPCDNCSMCNSRGF